MIWEGKSISKVVRLVFLDGLLGIWGWQEQDLAELVHENMWSMPCAFFYTGFPTIPPKVMHLTIQVNPCTMLSAKKSPVKVYTASEHEDRYWI